MFFNNSQLIKDNCCHKGSAPLRFVGDGTTTVFTIPTGATITQVTTDGRTNDPATEFSYNSANGQVTFVGAPADGVIILIFL